MKSRPIHGYVSARAKSSGNQFRLKRKAGSEVNGHTLIELLVATVIMVLLAALLLPPVIKGFHCCRAWVEGCVAYHDNQVNVYLDDASPEEKLLKVSTNNPVPIWFHSKIRS